MLQARQCEKSTGEAAPVRIKGQILRLSEHREVAIYLRYGDVGIADFIDGRGELVDVVSWFRFNCGSPANAYVSRRMAIESAQPLSADLIARSRHFIVRSSRGGPGRCKGRLSVLRHCFREHPQMTRGTAYPSSINSDDKENTCIPRNASKLFRP
jgi:hypothetical protein